MSFLKMFKDWAGSDSEEKQKFVQAWDGKHGSIWQNGSAREYHTNTAWQIYLLEKEVELLRMKKQ